MRHLTKYTIPRFDDFIRGRIYGNRSDCEWTNARITKKLDCGKNSQNILTRSPS